jgi:hypothetical protein
LVELLANSAQPWRSNKAPLTNPLAGRQCAAQSNRAATVFALAQGSGCYGLMTLQGLPVAQSLVIVELQNDRPVRPCEHQRIEIAIFSRGGAAEVVQRAWDSWPAQLPQALMRQVFCGGEYRVECGSCRRILAAIARPHVTVGFNRRHARFKRNAVIVLKTAGGSPEYRTRKLDGSRVKKRIARALEVACTRPVVTVGCAIEIVVRANICRDRHERGREAEERWIGARKIIRVQFDLLEARRSAFKKIQNS